jgi:hypothetical protein
VQACVAAGKWLAPQADNTLEAAAQTPSQVFAGARIALHGPHNVVQPFRLTLEHAGLYLLQAIGAVSCMQLQHYFDTA